MGWTLGLIAQQEYASLPPSNGFMQAVLTKGGAEGWVQVELTRRYQTLPNTAWVQREQNIYTNPRQACDFVICCTNNALTCIELKVESMYASADEGRATMPHNGWQQVQADVLKLRNNRNAIYANSQAYVVAIVWSNELINGMDSWLWGSGLSCEKEQYEANEQGIRWPVTVYVISV